MAYSLEALDECPAYSKLDPGICTMPKVKGISVGIDDAS